MILFLYIFEYNFKSKEYIRTIKNSLKSIFCKTFIHFFHLPSLIKLILKLVHLFFYNQRQVSVYKTRIYVNQRTVKPNLKTKCSINYCKHSRLHQFRMFYQGTGYQTRLWLTINQSSVQFRAVQCSLGGCIKNALSES